MKRTMFKVTALAASLMMSTAMAATAADNDGDSMNASDSMNSGGSMQSEGTMSSGDSMSAGDTMNSDDSMQSDDSMSSGDSMQSDDSMGSEDTMKSDDAMASGDTVMVGGAPMYPDKTIVENASQAKNLTTLVAAVKAAGLVETLSGDGPFTVFAPTNAAFDNLPDGTVKTLLEPENKSKLTKILTYHVVPGTITAADLAERIKAGNGSANLTTVEGDVVTAKMDNGKVVLIDKNGGGAVVTKADVTQSNGVVHVIGAVLMP